MSHQKDSTVTIVQWIIGGFVLVVAIALGYNIYIDWKKGIAKFDSPNNVSINPSIKSSIQPTEKVLIETFPTNSIQPTQSPKSEPVQPKSKNALDLIAGEYKTILEPKILADAKKEGIDSVTGKWIIKSEGRFEAILTTVSAKNEVQELKTSGRIFFKNGKVVTQVETVNGERPTQTPPEQLYTLSNDGQELLADGQPVKLIRQ